MSSQTLESLTQQLLEAAKSAGAEAADAIALRGTSLNVGVREGKLEQAERSEGLDFGLRVFVGQKQAVVSASDGSPDTIRTLADRAVAMAAEAPDDPYAGLAESDQLARDWDLASLELADPSPEPEAEALKEDALSAETAALAHDGITQVLQASAAYGERDIHTATSAGFSGGYRRTERIISCGAITGEGLEMERDFSGDGRVFHADLRSPEEIGNEAAERTLARRGARKPPTGTFPVLFDERVASSLVGHLVVASNGASIARGASWLRDCLGEQILPAGIDLIEDPHRPRASHSRPFDAEGLPTQRRMLIEDGKLQGWTLDLATARKLGLSSTANAARSVSGPPSPVTWNLELTQGAASREDLIRDMGTGLLVTSMIGSTINPNTGDYSRGAAGHWVENGEIAYPVNECTIASNLRDMLANIVPANDARPWLSRVVPSLLVPGMTLAGS